MLDEYAGIFRFITALASVIVLVGGGRLFLWVRKYFPERGETISPEKLREELGLLNRALCDKIEKTDFVARESFNGAVGRAQTSFEMQLHSISDTMAELKDSMIEAHRKAAAAEKEAVTANHKVELVQKDVKSLETLVMEKIDHLTTLVKGGLGK